MSPPRLSIIPAAAVFDPNLEGSDLKVLCALGMNINDAGWCRRSQVKLARQLNVSRSTVQRSLTRLAQSGWIEIKVIVDESGRDSPHMYRVVLDPHDAEDGCTMNLDDDFEISAVITAPMQRARPLPTGGHPLPAGGHPLPIQGGHPLPSHEWAPPAHTGRAPKNDLIINDPIMNDSIPRGARNNAGKDLKSTVLGELRKVLDEERSQAVIDHRKAIRKPLTPHAAKLLARQFAQVPDPNAAADMMIGSGWQGFSPDWVKGNTPNRGTPQPVPRKSDHQLRHEQAKAAVDRAMKGTDDGLSRKSGGQDVELGPADFKLI